MKAANSISLPVLYGDTDSIFVNNPSHQQIDHLVNFANVTHNIELEVDKEYKYLVLSKRKKNYFGVKKDGTLDVKGLMGKKANTPPFVRELFWEILNGIKIKVDKKSIESRIKNTIEKFGEIPLEKLCYKTMLNKEPHEYKVKPPALKAAELLDTPPTKGQFIQFVKTRNGVKPIQLTSPKEVDRTKYMESLEGVMVQITDPLGISMDALLGRGKKTTMEDFW